MVRASIARIYEGQFWKWAGLFLYGEFILTQANFAFTLFLMNKQEIKDRLLGAVKSDSHFDDIKSVALFGSYVSGEPAETSDVDVLVRFTDDARIGFFEYVRIQRNLASALGLNVDLVTPAALSKYIKPQILEQAEVVYER